MAKESTKSEICEGSTSVKVEDGCNCIANSECGKPYHWIQEINQSRKDLTILPPLDTNRFRFCIKIDLSNNKLTGSFDWLLALKRIEWIDLSNNELTSLPHICPSSSSIKYFDVSSNFFTTLPEWILHLEDVRFLSLKHNPIADSFGFLLKKAQWRNIEHCYIGNMNVTIFPNCLQTAPKLAVLDIGNNVNEDRLGKNERNSLWSLPDQLPPSLTALKLRSLYLNNLDCSWKSLNKLRELDASCNQIRWLPEDLSSLNQLHDCSFSWNRIYSLPDDIGALKHLKSLKLSHNFLGLLPRSLEQLENLVHLDLYANDIEVVECNLSRLTKLEEADLWMNRIDPSMYLDNHEALCLRLRNKMTENRNSEKLKPPSDSSSTLSPASSYFNSASSYDENDVTEIPLETNLPEETWDTEGFTDDDEVPKRLSKLPNCEWSPSKDEHYFRPSDLHAPSYVKPPFHFGPDVPGQFDDAD